VSGKGESRKAERVPACFLGVDAGAKKDGRQPGTKKKKVGKKNAPCNDLNVKKAGRSSHLSIAINKSEKKIATTARSVQEMGKKKHLSLKKKKEMFRKKRGWSKNGWAKSKIRVCGFNIKSAPRLLAMAIQNDADAKFTVKSRRTGR